MSKSTLVFATTRSRYRVSNNTLLCSGACPTTTTTASRQKKPARRHTTLQLSQFLPAYIDTEKAKNFNPLQHILYRLRYSPKYRAQRAVLCQLEKNLPKLSTRRNLRNFPQKKKKKTGKKSAKSEGRLLGKVQSAGYSSLHYKISSLSQSTLHALNLLSEN